MKNSFFFWRKKTLFGILEIQLEIWKIEILGNILKLYLAIIFGVQIFRVFEVLGKLLYVTSDLRPFCLHVVSVLLFSV